MKQLTLLIFILLLQACGKPTTLKVQHDDTGKYNGPLKELSELSFLAPELTDKRNDTTRIGAKKNGYGSDVGDVITEKPVKEIISDAISTAFIKNGHSVIDDGRIKIVGEISNFWLEFDINFFTVEFIGDVKCQLAFIDTKTGQEIYSAEYSGHYAKKKAGGAKKTWQTIMSEAVNDLIEDIIFDEDLKDSLEEIQ